MNDDIEQFIRQASRRTSTTRAESGHALSPEVKNAAFQQVLHYWRRLHDLAERITDTEVRLNLPNARRRAGSSASRAWWTSSARRNGRRCTTSRPTTRSSSARTGTLPGPAQHLRAHLVQARGAAPGQTAVISTHLPAAVKDAISGGDAETIADEMGRWEPVIPIRFDADNVETTIQDLGKVVNRIEGGKCSSASVARLRKRDGERTFGDRVCGSCDVRNRARLREYADAPRGRIPPGSRRNYAPLADDAESARAWREAALPEEGPEAARWRTSERAAGMWSCRDFLGLAGRFPSVHQVLWPLLAR